MPYTKADVLDAMKQVPAPGGNRSLIDAGLVTKASACDGFVSVTIAAPEPARAELQRITQEAINAHAQSKGETIQRIAIDFTDAPASKPQGATLSVGGKEHASPSGIPGVQRIIAVGAGKGGVGKSTVSVNLAVALAREGHAVGLMDGDIYGPSVPTLMGLRDHEVYTHGNMLQPFYVHGVKAMTLGKLVEEEKPLIWRGPMAHGAFKQLAAQTDWGELDYLIIDLPPGTGDVPLTMSQLLKLTGAVIVCTPQRVAQDDAVRAARMFQQLGIDILGVVENMSFFLGDDGKEYDLFGRGGAEQMAQRLALPFLGAIPISMPLRENSDRGNPSANFNDQGPLKASLEKVARQLENQVALATMHQKGPSLTVR